MVHDSSNLDGHLQVMLEGCAKLVTTWELLNYTEKQRLQYLLFPKGMLYDRKNDAVRTPEANFVFTQIVRLTGVWDKRKPDKPNIRLIYPVKSISLYSISLYSILQTAFDRTQKAVSG